MTPKPTALEPFKKEKKKTSLYSYGLGGLIRLFQAFNGLPDTSAEEMCIIWRDEKLGGCNA